MQAQYPLKVQTIRTKGTKERYYVYLPMPLAAALGMRSGEQVHWELLDRGELRVDAGVKVPCTAGEKVPCGFMTHPWCGSFCLRW